MIKDSGITLIEVVTVIALIVLVAYIIMSTDFSSYRSYSFRNERDSLIADLQRSRSEALNNICFGTCTDGASHGIHFQKDNQNNQYVNFQGTSWDTHDASLDEIISIHGAMQITGPTDVIFSNLSGDVDVTPSGSYNITLTDNMNHTSIISLNSVGQIKWTN